ncbi:MAG: hypothetical protein D6753_12375 [Planctomycetota bacterium]|nr:MAG: hypothetical protein D6753_12375 [Planctomycetota bacterium]
MVAVILALAASLSPVAVPAWGGDWASLVVLAAGLGVLGVAVFVLPTRRLKFVPAAAVLGQLIVLYGVIHLCTTGTLLEPLLYTWRPLFAWAAGASAVCLLGAVGVLGGRWRFRPRGDEAEQWLADPAMERATQWMSASTLTVGLAAGMGLAAAGVDMQFAVAAGWMLVATAWLWYMATRWRAWQEVACWTTVLYGVAWSQFAMQRWVDPAALMVPEHVAALVAAGLAALWLCALGLKPMAVLGDRWLGAAALSDGPRPASPPAAPAWLVVLATLALAFAWTPAGLQRVAAALCREFQLSQTMGLSPPGTVVAGVAAAMLWFSPIVLYRQLPSGVRRFVLECVPLLFGWIATLAVAGQDAAIALLWTLAAWDLVVSKTLPLLAERIGRESHGRWAATFLNPGIQQMIATARTPFVVWVAIATISVAAVWAAAVQVLPAELSRALQAGEWTSAWTMRMLLFGPALVVGLANWWHSTWRTAHVHSHGANLSATATCATVGVLTSLDGWTATNLWGLESGILFTLYFGLAGGVLGWIHTLRMGPTDGGSNAIRPHERFLVWLTGGATAVLGSVGVGMALGLAFSTSSTEVLTLMARLGAPDGSVLLAFAGSLLLWTHRANRRAGLAQLTTLLPWCVPLFVSHWIYWVEETALVSSIDTFAPSRWIAMGWFLCALTEAPWNRRPGHVRSATMLRYWSGVLLVAALLSLVLAVTDPQHLAVLYVLVLGALVTVTASLNGHELARKTAAIVLGTAGAGLAWYVVWPPASMMHAVLRAVSIGWGPLLVVVAAELQQGLLHRLGIRPFTTDADKPGDVSLIVCGGVALVLLPYTLAAGFLVHANAFYWEVLSAFGLALGAGGLLMMRVLRGCHACRLEPMYLSVLSIAVCGELLAIERLGLSALHHMVLWMVALFMAMVAIAGVVRELYLRYQAWSARLTRLPATVPFDELAKMAQRVINVHMVAGLIGIVPVVTLVLLADDRSLRLAATVIPLLAAVSLLVLPGAHLRRPVQLLGLALLSCTVVMTAWADLPEAAWGAASPVRWAYHHRLFVACSAWAVALHALGAKGMLGRDWIAPIAVVGWVMLAVGTVAGGWLTVLEFIDWRDLAAAAHPAAKGLTLVAWALVFARLLVLAVTPKDLGFDLPRAERHAAVYMAEGVVVVFSAAVYLHFPQWFTGWMVHWWPIVVVMVAYSSLALGQVLQRGRLDVLSDPVARSGLLLPLIPLAGVWWWGVAEDTVWRDFDRFAFLVALAAAFYATYAYTRRTAWAHLVSIALAVLAFWLWLYSQPDLRFARHPQLWIVPPTLIVLAFAEWHRRRLPTSLRLVVRYMSLLLIYSSSTAEVFLRAFAGQFWPPLVLLVLSLTGVAAGIVLRIRPFLYCGALFTAVALVGMVWHAQQAIGQIWPWWAFGIATGVAAIFLLGYIEKNKPRMRAYLEQIREWE